MSEMYKVEYEKRLQATMYYLVYYIDLMITMFLMIFQRFPTILQKMSKGHAVNVSKQFPKIC